MIIIWYNTYKIGVENLKTLYLYVPNEKVDDYIKYGIKLSQSANKVVTFDRAEKKGIISYLSPKDCDKYSDKNFTCLKIDTNKLNILIYNKTALDLTNDKDFICNIKDYIYGNYEEPRALICSTILPENISIYNKIIDTPLIIQSSKEFYYKHTVLDMLDNELFTSFEVYQLLLILGQKKKLFKVKEVDKKLKLYIDKRSNKKYTKKSNF